MCAGACSALDRGPNLEFSVGQKSLEKSDGSSNFGALGVFWNSRISSLFLRRKLIITKLLKQAHLITIKSVRPAGTSFAFDPSCMYLYSRGMDEREPIVERTEEDYSADQRSGTDFRGLLCITCAVSHLQQDRWAAGGPGKAISPTAG